MSNKPTEVIDAEYVVIGEETIPMGLAKPTGELLPANRRASLKEALSSVPSVQNLPSWRDGGR